MEHKRVLVLVLANRLQHARDGSQDDVSDITDDCDCDVTLDDTDDRLIDGD